MEGMNKSIEAVYNQCPEAKRTIVLVDGNRLPPLPAPHAGSTIEAKAVVHGDALVLCCCCCCIVLDWIGLLDWIDLFSPLFFASLCVLS